MDVWASVWEEESVCVYVLVGVVCVCVCSYDKLGVGAMVYFWKIEDNLGFQSVFHLD